MKNLVLFQSKTHIFSAKGLNWNPQGTQQVAFSPVGLFSLKPARLGNQTGHIPLLNDAAFPILFDNETEAQNAAQTAQWLATNIPMSLDGWKPNSLGGHSVQTPGHVWETVQGTGSQKSWFITHNTQPAALFFHDIHAAQDACQQYLVHLLLSLMVITPKVA